MTLANTFGRADATLKLIYVNIAVFGLLKIVSILFTLFNFSSDFLLAFLAVPSSLLQLLLHIWTPFTYMFLHEGFFHLLFNMLCLYSFGKVFLVFFNEKQLIGLYLFGGLIAAGFYILAFNIFPYFSPYVPHGLLLGASGSVVAIIIAGALKAPEMKMQLLFLGSISLKYIAIATVLMSFFGITSANGGGQLAHLGGALAGYLFIVSLQKGKDLTKGFSFVVNGIYNLLSPRKLKVKPNPNATYNRMSDADFNMNKAKNMQEIDKILDKIKSSGYESLTVDEKRKLFNQGK